MTLPNDIGELRLFLKGHPEHKPSAPRGPGLGLGSRLGFITAISAMRAIRATGLDASAVQASVMRELAPDFVDAKNRFVDYKGIGRVPLGHTGMTIRGEFLESVRERIRRNITVPYVADADHIPVAGTSEKEVELVGRLVDEARDRTFFTLDAHFCVDPGASGPDQKFGEMLRALETASRAVEEAKRGDPHAVEISIDECEGVTSECDLRYIVDQAVSRKRVSALFSVAPALGFDKKDEDGAETRGLLRRALPALHGVLSDHGLVMGVHSGDGKSKETLRAIGESTEGSVWYKVSPDRQRQFFALLEESENPSERELFDAVLGDLLSMVEANCGSDDEQLSARSRQCLAEARETRGPPFSARKIFFDFGFLLMTKHGRAFKSLSDSFYERYFERDLAYIRRIASNLGLAARAPE